jgi:hypothetical protein
MHVFKTNDQLQFEQWERTAYITKLHDIHESIRDALQLTWDEMKAEFHKFDNDSSGTMEAHEIS